MHYGSFELALEAKKRVEHLPTPTAIVEISDEVRTTADVARYASALHNHFFTPTALAVYETIVEPRVFGHRFFLTSETIDGEMKWTIRQFRIRFTDTSASMNVNTADGFNFRQFRTFKLAFGEIQRVGKLAERRGQRGVTF